MDVGSVVRGELPKRVATVAVQVALLSAMSRLGHEIVVLLHLPLPGNVAGMLLTFAALSCGLLPLRYVEQGAGLLVLNLPLFFVRPAVGFMAMAIAAIAVSIVAPMLVPRLLQLLA